MRFAILIFLTMLCTASAQYPTTWKQEPTSFLGVQFGKPLSDSYPECPREIHGGQKAYISGQGSGCWHAGGNDQIVIKPGLFFKIYVQSIRGNVASITASFQKSDFPRISREFIAIYGEPQWRNHPPMDMKGGGKLPSHGLNWFGKDINIFCSSQSPIRNEGFLGVDNKAWQQFLAKTAVQ